MAIVHKKHALKLEVVVRNPGSKKAQEERELVALEALYGDPVGLPSLQKSVITHKRSIKKCTNAHCVV